MSLESSIWRMILPEHKSEFVEDLLVLHNFKSKHNDLWKKIPLCKINIFDAFKFSEIFETIFKYAYSKYTWTDFNKLISRMYVKCTNDKNYIMNIKITIAKKNDEISQTLQSYFQDIYKNKTTVTVKHKLSILGGFVIDMGSTRIDASYANILNKFIGELNESFKH